jgi:hypothetical protein
MRRLSRCHCRLATLIENVKERSGCKSVRNAGLDTGCQPSPERLIVGARQHLSEQFNTLGTQLLVHLVQGAEFLL